MRSSLRQLIGEAAFASLWPSEVPDYDGFIDTLATRLRTCLPANAEGMQLSCKPVSANRVRIDGTCLGDSKPLAFWAEIVWLRASRTYRGEAHARQIPPSPPFTSKSIDDLVLALKNISANADIIVSAQANAATHGLVLDDTKEMPEHAVDAIFALFERFPDEDFSTLADLLKPSEYTAQRALSSIRQRPNWAAIELLAGFLHAKEKFDARDSAFQELRNLAASGQWEHHLHEAARHALTQPSK